jgi:hypothetical protein
MLRAIQLANSGAGEEANMLAIQEYNDAIAQMVLAERQLKELSKDPGKYLDEVRLKQTELINFQTNMRPLLDERFIRALQKPTSSFINEQQTTGVEQ